MTKLFVARRGTSRNGCRAVMLRAVGVAGILTLLGSASPAGAATVSQTFNYTGGEQMFTVPAGISSVQVVAVGGSGGSSSAGGGAAARVAGQVSVSAAETLYVEVAGLGGEGGGYNSGGFNGGGAGGGGGGGASDVRTSPLALGLSPEDRLLVAGGGGGGGYNGGAGAGAGGTAGQRGMNGTGGNEAGEAGTQSSGGSGGSGCAENGTHGQLGMGGAGGARSFYGGGGGGGYYGGGGGGASCGNGGGGGGGGASLVPAGGTLELVAWHAEPEVQISYTKTNPTVVTEAASGVAQAAATLNATVNPGGQMVTDCHFQYGPTEEYGAQAPCEPAPGSGEGPVAVSASLTELTPKSSYHFRIVATSEGGTSYGSDQTFETLPNPPVVISVKPAAGFESGGTSVTITGANLAEANAVKFGSANAASFKVNSATSITAVSPAEPPGSVHVTVVNSGGSSATSPGDQFTYVAPGRVPTVTALSTTTGPAAGGTSVTITGTSFVGVTAVKFGEANAASFETNSATSITAVSPPGTTGTVELIVTTPNGESGITPKADFRYGSPTVTNLSPNTSSQAGTPVTVTGSGFGPGTATTFKFGSALGTSVNCTTTTTCAVVAPPAAKAGTVNVIATVNKQISAKSLADQFTYKPPPSVTSLSPDVDIAAGGTPVTIAGTSFTGATAVKFGSASAASYEVNSATSITAVSPPGTTGTVDVIVTTPNGVSRITSSDRFTFEAPTVTSLSTSSGSKGGGTPVTVTGSGFGLGTEATTFSFGAGLAIDVNCSSTTTCTMLSPAARRTGTVDVIARVGGKNSATNPPGDQFAYN